MAEQHGGLSRQDTRYTNRKSKRRERGRERERKRQGRGRCCVVPVVVPGVPDEEGAAPSLDHPERLRALVSPVDLPAAPRYPRLSPSYPRESIVRGRCAPWLGSAARGWFRRRAAQRVATTPERRRRAPIRRATTGFGDRRTLSQGRARSFLLVCTPLASTPLPFLGLSRYTRRIAPRKRDIFVWTLLLLLLFLFFFPFLSLSLSFMLPPAHHSECHSLSVHLYSFAHYSAIVRANFASVFCRRPLRMLRSI